MKQGFHNFRDPHGCSVGKFAPLVEVPDLDQKHHVIERERAEQPMQAIHPTGRAHIFVQIPKQKVVTRYGRTVKAPS